MSGTKEPDGRHDRGALRAARPGLYFVGAMLLVYFAPSDSAPWWFGVGLALAGLLTWCDILLERQSHTRRHPFTRLWPFAATSSLAIGVFFNMPQLIWMWLGMFAVVLLDPPITALIARREAV